MKKKYFILALTFLCLLMGQSSFGQTQGSSGDYDGSGDTWTDENGLLWGEDSEGRIYLDINGDGKLDLNEVIEFETETNETNSSSGSSSGGSFSSWGGGTSVQITISSEDDSSNDVASSDNSGYPYLGGTSLVVSSTSSYSGDSSSWDNIVYLVEYSGPSYVSNNVVYIKLADGTYKRPSQLNPNSDGDKKALNEFAALLARNLNDNNNSMTIASNPGTSLSSKVPAFTNGQTINLNSNGGFSKDLDNINSFKSILKHEILHVDDNKNNIVDTYETHADVYLKQMKHTSFKNAKPTFKISIAHSFCNYLLNIDQKNMRDNTIYDHDTVLSRIKQFNEENIGVMTIIGPEFGRYFTGQLSLEVKMNGYAAQTVNYEYEIN